MYSTCRARNNVLILLFLFVAHIHASLLSLLPRLTNPLSARAIADTHGVPLRILPLGASITYGLHSSDGNGYRYALRGALIAAGNDVNMVGVVSHGNMSNNLVSGFPGQRIDQVGAKKDLALGDKPNIVLLELGTNDCAQNYSISDAHARLGSLVGRVLNASPNTTVIVGTLLPNANADTEANILQFNAELPDMVAGLAGKGYKVSLVDFHSDWWSVADLQADGTHPTDMGYIKMSRVWYDGIVAAAKGGNITAAAVVQGVDDYAAKNDSAASHTAINVVCQHVNDSVSAQVEACSSRANRVSPGRVSTSREGVLNIALIVLLAAAYTLF